MLNLDVDDLYELDLRDDFIMNDSKDLYEFIGNDPVKAFYLGSNIKKWFAKLDKDKQYLYSKQLRRNQEGVEKYRSQIDFWIKRFAKGSKEVPLIATSEYVLNNMIYEEETSETDSIKLSFMLGQLFGQNRSDEELQVDN